MVFFSGQFFFCVFHLKLNCCMPLAFHVMYSHWSQQKWPGKKKIDKIICHRATEILKRKCTKPLLFWWIYDFTQIKEIIQYPDCAFLASHHSTGNDRNEFVNLPNSFNLFSLFSCKWLMSTVIKLFLHRSVSVWNQMKIKFPFFLKFDKTKMTEICPHFSIKKKESNSFTFDVIEMIMMKIWKRNRISFIAKSIVIELWNEWINGSKGDVVCVYALRTGS